ncbi:MAG: DEAD/DEAH box helicase family protein [Bacteroidia bacterium]|jgi:superfamily II DNA or RNA helicase|nr:DEAD/DEAH box helicase family protein [Bacteroidia bacterium]
MEEPSVTLESRKLYPYQEGAVNNIFRELLELPPNANLLFQLPTGGGKTIIFSEIAKRYIEKFGRKVLILTHRIELGKQTSSVLTEAGIVNKVITSEVKQLPHQSHYQSFIALVETLNNRLQENDQFVEDIGLVIVDEAHNNSFRKIFHYFQDVNILGVTATPLSSNKKLPLYQTYQKLIVGESISNLIEQGYLCEGQTFSYDVNLSSLRVGNNGEFTVGSHELLYTQAMMQSKLIEAYDEVANRKKTLIFNAGILTSRAVYETFKSKGYPIRHLDSTFSDRDRVETLEWFRNTKDGILTSVSILTTGFDEPEVENIILNRATKSLTLYHQMIGRGSRVLPEKRTFNIIDLGNNSRRFNLWQYPIDWNHVFASPHLYLEQRYKDEWDYELVNDYEMPPDIKERFLNSSAEAFIVRDRYLMAIRKGKKPQTVVEESLEDHFARIKDNASDFEEAIELFELLGEEMKYRMKQLGKCINASSNHTDWQAQTYASKLRRRLMTYYAENES